MTSNRCYQPARSHGDAVDELVRGSGSQFDPRVVGALCRHLGRGLPALAGRSPGAGDAPAAIAEVAADAVHS